MSHFDVTQLSFIDLFEKLSEGKWINEEGTIGLCEQLVVNLHRKIDHAINLFDASVLV